MRLDLVCVVLLALVVVAVLVVLVGLVLVVLPWRAMVRVLRVVTVCALFSIAALSQCGLLRTFVAIAARQPVWTHSCNVALIIKTLLVVVIRYFLVTFTMIAIRSALLVIVATVIIFWASPIAASQVPKSHRITDVIESNHRDKKTRGALEVPTRRS